MRLTKNFDVVLWWWSFMLSSSSWLLSLKVSLVWADYHAVTVLVNNPFDLRRDDQLKRLNQLVGELEQLPKCRSKRLPCLLENLRKFNYQYHCRFSVTCVTFNGLISFRAVYSAVVERLCNFLSHAKILIWELFLWSWCWNNNAIITS